MINKKVRDVNKVYIYSDKIIVPIFIFGKSNLKARSIGNQQMRIKRESRYDNNTQLVAYLVFNNCTKKLPTLHSINKYTLISHIMLKSPIIEGKPYRIIKIKREKLRDILKNYYYFICFKKCGIIPGYNDLTAEELINESINI